MKYERFIDEAIEMIEYFDAAVELMDDEIREEVHDELAPCTDLEFLAAYIEKHYEMYGEIFKI